MPLENRQILLLRQYRDRSYIMMVLCEKSFEHFNFIKTICNIPLILISSIMAILNSSAFDPHQMKIPNIVINSLTAMLIALISNFKVNEKEVAFKSLQNKFMKLTHSIEDDLNNHLNTLESDDISNVINQYDNLIEQIEFTFSNRIKNNVKNIYKNKRTLPSVLNCEQMDFSISEPASPLSANLVVNNV